MPDTNESDTIRAVARTGIDALEAAGARANLPPWLLPHLVGVERRRKGRFGQGGIRTQFVEALEHAAAGTRPLGVGEGPAAIHPARAPEVVLRWLELRNFRVFERARLDLTHDPLRPIVLLEGTNGSGKSNLIAALRWALVEHAGASRVPSEFLHENADGDRPELRVRLALDIDGDPVEVWRRCAFERRSSGFVPGAATLTVRLPGGVTLQDAEASDWLGGRLPPEVVGYFVFDAESTLVQELSGQKGESLPEVRNQVEAAVGAAPIRAAAMRCQEIAKEWSREATQLGPGESAAPSDPREARDRAIRERAVAQRARAEAERLRARIDQIDQLLVAASAEGGERRGSARERIMALRREIAELRGRLRSALTEDVPLALLDGCLPRESSPGKAASAELSLAMDTISGLVEAGRFEWARPVPAATVRESLMAALGLRVDDGDADADASLRDRVRLAVSRTAGLSRLVAAEAELRHLDGTVEPESDPGPAEALRAEKRERAKERDAQLSLAAAADERGEVAEAEADRMQPELRLAQDRAARRKRKQQASDGAFAVADALIAAADRIRDLGLAALERSASRVLQQTTNKPELYAGMRFDRGTLRYRVVDHEERRTSPDPSTGERTVLALALVTGLQRASGMRFPLFMEALFKPLDPVHQDKVARWVLADRDDQTLLLLKPGEMPKSLEHLLESRVGQRLGLRRPHKDRNRSEIIAGAAP
jgi:DNA sulfur modification protein DndD